MSPWPRSVASGNYHPNISARGTSFWNQVPQGGSSLPASSASIPNAWPDDFEAAAPRCPVFEIGPMVDEPPDRERRLD
jgi:hypothetical protein